MKHCGAINEYFTGKSTMKQVYVKNRREWREWLTKNHGGSSGIWLVFYKRHTGKPTLEYDDAVEEALCFGWIDSIIKKIDEDKYVRKLTPRKADSRWSKLNKKRVAQLIERGLMTEAGTVKIEEAKASGLWSQPERSPLSLEIPGDLKITLEKNEKAGRFFDQLAPSYQKQFIGWISAAKRPETRDRRLRESIALMEQGEKLGMK
jgi:uncharacterized protein YdeI (YjbR/CyaY-like superfamily)